MSDTQLETEDEINRRHREKMAQAQGGARNGCWRPRPRSAAS